MPSKLHHITRRRRNALAALSAKNYGQYTPDEVERIKQERAVLETRITAGAHSSNWFKRHAKRKALADEIREKETAEA